MTFQEEIEGYLEKLPSQWREDLTQLFCRYHETMGEISCDQVTACETLTTLSNFTVIGTSVSIQYKDEHSVAYNRTFDVTDMLNNELSSINPQCLTDQITWSNMSYIQRLQLLIDSHCECCETP